MFAKLLKHEWRATRGSLGTLCLVSLAASLLGGLTMRYLVWASSAQGSENQFLVVISVLAMIGAIIVVAVSGVAALFLLIGRFYKSRFTDEGYLTFTLPVSVHQNLLASMTNTILGMILVFLAICACGVVWLLIGFSAFEGFMDALWRELPQLWSELARVFGEFRLGDVVLALGNVICSFVCQIVVLMLSVTVGAIVARKHKILMAVGVYYGIQVGISVLMTIMMSSWIMTRNEVGRTFFSFYGAMGLLEATVTVAGYFLMFWLLNKKLNLN